MLLFERYIKTFHINGATVHWTQRATETNGDVKLENVFRNAESDVEYTTRLKRRMGLPFGMHPHFTKQVIEARL